MNRFENFDCTVKKNLTSWPGHFCTLKESSMGKKFFFVKDEKRGLKNNFKLQDA